MTEINVMCPHCGEKAKAPAEGVGQNADCPSCGKNFRIPSSAAAASSTVPKRAEPVPATAPRNPPPMAEKTAVVVTDIRMPFGSMVVFMIKWTIASIPAFIILAILGSLASAMFIMGGCAALMMGAK